MYPYKLFAGLDLYTILMVLGVVTCMLFIRLMGDKRGLCASLQNLILVDTVVAVVAGYGSAVLFQAYYNYRATGTFEIVHNTGATFYGGLIGGAAAFILVYFVVGYLLFPERDHIRQFRTVSDIAAPAIAVAHGIGRLGCLMAGCCHGRITDAWYGIPMDIVGDGIDTKVKVIPVQLYEAVFLLALSGVLLYLFIRGKKYLLPSYMMTYAVWRFFAETLRGDDRGQLVAKLFSPSQYLSLLILVGGLLLLVLELYADIKKTSPENEEASPADEISADGEET